MLLNRLRGRVAEQTNLDRIIDVLDLLGSIFFLTAAILAFFVPPPVPPPPGVSSSGPRLPTDRAPTGGDGAGSGDGDGDRQGAPEFPADLGLAGDRDAAPDRSAEAERSAERS